jgi:5-methylcytosine-specific restriction endonuclease McrA
MKWQYHSDECVDLRDEVLQSADHICADCGGIAEPTRHTTYRYGIICPPTYLVALCWECHRRRHGRDDWDKEEEEDEDWGGDWFAPDC